MKRKHDINKVLRIGDTLFREQGYHNTGTEEILKKANYPRSSFYYHFKNKEGFGVKTIEFYGNNIKSMLQEIVSNKKLKSPTERLKQYFITVSTYVQEKEYDTCCLVQRFSIEAGEKPGLLQEMAYEQFKGWVGVALGCIEEGQHIGEFREDITALELSEFLFSSIFGAFTVGRLSRDPKELEKKMALAFKLIRR